MMKMFFRGVPERWGNKNKKTTINGIREREDKNDD
jgi:hypothetical protein